MISCVVRIEQVCTWQRGHVSKLKYQVLDFRGVFWPVVVQFLCKMLNNYTARIDSRGSKIILSVMIAIYG